MTSPEKKLAIHSKHPPHKIARDVFIIIASIVIAIILGKAGIFEQVIESSQGFKFLGIFIAGLFFTSLFTTAPATVALAQMAQVNNIFEVAIIGALGAMISDTILFHFLKSYITEDITHFLEKSTRQLKHVFHLRIFRWLFPFLGALIIASPLPDEPGLALMGLVKLKMTTLMPLSYFLNVFGIIIIGLIAKSIG